MQQLLGFRGALQTYSAESQTLDKALEVVRAAGRKGGASVAERQDADAIQALLSDIVEETELMAHKHTAAAIGEGSALQLSFRAQKRQQRLRLADLTESGAELFNQLGDIYYTFSRDYGPRHVGCLLLP